MRIEHTDDGIDDADASRPDRHPPPPPDKPGTDGYPLRADSRRAVPQGGDEDHGEASGTTDESQEIPTGGAVTTRRLGETIHESDRPAAAPDPRTTVWEKYPGDYNPPSDSETHAIGDRRGPFEQPATWIGDVNPGYGDPSRPDRYFNCAECARAVERNWRGDSQVSAGLVPPQKGELNDRTEAWSAADFKRMDFSEIAERLAAGGHGASAIVGVDWHSGDGHYFNAVNANGDILAMDGQTGQIERWPPSIGGLGYDASDVRLCEAIVRDQQGRDL